MLESSQTQKNKRWNEKKNEISRRQRERASESHGQTFHHAHKQAFHGSASRPHPVHLLHGSPCTQRTPANTDKTKHLHHFTQATELGKPKAYSKQSVSVNNTKNKQPGKSGRRWVLLEEAENKGNSSQSAVRPLPSSVGESNKQGEEEGYVCLYMKNEGSLHRHIYDVYNT